MGKRTHADDRFDPGSRIGIAYMMDPVAACMKPARSTYGKGRRDIIRTLPTTWTKNYRRAPGLIHCGNAVATGKSVSHLPRAVLEIADSDHSGLEATCCPCYVYETTNREVARLHEDDDGCRGLDVSSPS